MKGLRICLLLLVLFATLCADTSAQRSRGRAGVAPPKGAFRVGADGGTAILGDDLTKSFDNYRLGPFANIDVGYVAHQNFVVALYGSIGSMSSSFGDQEAGNFFLSYGLHFEGRILSNRGAIIPFAYVRLGGLTMRPSLTHAGETTEADEVTAFTYGIGAGIEFLVKKGRNPISIRLMGGGTLTTTDELDMLNSGGNKDGFSYISAGILFYFSRR